MSRTMPLMEQIRNDPRRRNLAVLVAIAIVSIVLALLALKHQAAQTDEQDRHEAVFPGLGDTIHQIARIHVESQKYGGFDMAFDPRKGWVLPQHDDYPASFEQMRSTVAGMTNLQTIAPKTARPDWYEAIGVDAPPKGSGTLTQLFDDKGNILAALITGKEIDIGDTAGAVGLYLRKPGDAQSWLARSDFEPKSNPADWLDKNILSVDPSQIVQADVTPVSGPAFTLRRQGTGFVIADLPKGREEISPGAAGIVATALAGFGFEDVKRSSAFDFTNAPRFITRTVDGLTVTVRVLPENQAFWATVYAEGATPEAAREARAIDAHSDGWAYKLTADKGQLFMITLDTLLKPLAAKK